MNRIDPIKKAKQAAAKAAADLIKDGMVIGLGTGSTTNFFIEYLIERKLQDALNITVFPTSERSEKLAKEGGFSLCNQQTTTQLDITIDGADEIDMHKRMIKGGGGALLREKILATMSKEMIVIVDFSKVVERLGKFPLPVEIARFAYRATLDKIQTLGYIGEMRLNSDQTCYLTDNGNFIVDISFPNGCHAPEKDQNILNNIPGVIETGFFFNLAGRVIIGQSDGSIKLM